MDVLTRPKDVTTKSDVFIGGLYVLKSKKSYYAVLKDRVLEIYKSAKDEKSGKEPKFLFDLSLAFNVHLHYDAVLKDCIALMMPDETFLMRFESDVDSWFEMLIDKARQARSTKLGRPVFREEYFEVAWDVEPVKKPKLSKKARNEEPVEDLVAKNEGFLHGKKRLCMYPHTLYIVRKGITASEDANPPLCNSDYMTFPVNAISVYGHQDRYFFFRAGRCAPTGAGELWFYADTGDNASSINNKIIKICERESEKRKAQGRMPAVPTRTLRSQAHRERSHTHTQRSAAEAGSIKPVGHKLSAASFSGFPSSYTSRQLVPELSRTGSTTNPVVVKNSSSATERKQTNPKSAQYQPLKEEEHEQQRVADYVLPSGDTNEQTDSSGGTVTLGADARVSRQSTNPLLCYDYADKEFPSETGTEVASVTSGTGRLSVSQNSSGLSVQPEHLEGYTQMDCGQDRSHHSTPASDLNYTLTEVRSYVSTSTDSVESMKLSGRSNLIGSGDDQRAYSLGSRPLPCGQMLQPSNPSTLPSQTPGNSATNKSIDDPRKRAHSLGSKSWMKPLRKVPGMRTSIDHAESDEIRQRSDSFGTSSVFKGMSEKKDSKPSGSGLIGKSVSFKKLAQERVLNRGGQKKTVSRGNRTGSFSNRRGRLLQGDQQQADDLTEWDFGAIGRSGSSSMASVDGSNHSRTSSFGISSSALLRSAVEDVRKARNETDLDNPFEKIWSATNLEEMNNSRLLPADDNEYVFSSYGSTTAESSSKKANNSSNPRLIGTIMEQNVSSGSSRSQSPLSFKAKEADTDEQAKTEVMPLQCIKQSSSASEIVQQNLCLPTRTSREYSRSVSDGAVLGGEELGLDYAALDWQHSDVSAASSRTSVHFSGSLTNKGDSKTKCEYTVIRPYNP